MSLSIYEFDEYRSFLDAWLSEKRSRSVRGLASRIGCSAAHVSMIRNGDRKLSLEHARTWAASMRLDPYEADQFEAMVRAAHGPTETSRRLASHTVQSARAWHRAMQAERSLSVFSHWYVNTIHELARCAGFQAEPAWVADHLTPPISVQEAREALDLLFELGLLRRDGDRVVAVEFSGTTGDLAPTELSSAMERSHKAWLSWALEGRYSGAAARLMSIRVALDSARVDEIREHLKRLLVEAAELGADHAPDRVYEIGVALISRSRPAGD